MFLLFDSSVKIPHIRFILSVFFNGYVVIYSKMVPKKLLSNLYKGYMSKQAIGPYFVVALVYLFFDNRVVFACDNQSGNVVDPLNIF